MTSPQPIIHVPPPHPASLADDALVAQCTLTRGKSQGPGGQHRNKVETKVTLHHEPTGIEAHAGERRSQAQNKSVALFRLRLELATHVRCPVPLGEIRTSLWLSRVSPAGRIACNPEHTDFPTMLALALDVTSAAGWDVSKAALRLACTPSQLVKLVQGHSPAMVVFNQSRAERGLKRLQ